MYTRFGNPIGLEFQRTVTFGIVSAIDRTIKIEETYMEDLIQTDATINPGNSGGPLITAKGEIIGINSVKITSAEGIGFAVPINIMKPIIESFIKNGTYEEAYLGLFAYDKEVIPYLEDDIKIDTGIYVALVSKDGPSFGANIRQKDIILKIDDVVLNKMSDLRKYIYTKLPGDDVNLTVLRNGKENVVRIKLGKKG